MQKTHYINQLNPKEEFTSPFLIKYLAKSEGKDGKSYLNLIISDSTGEMEARKWHGAEIALGQVKVGDVVVIKAKVNPFQGRLQVIITEMSKLEANQYNKEDYVQKAGTLPETMYEELISIVNGLEEVYIRELLMNILSDIEISRRLKIWQAGKSIHHAYQSGLLEHILSCTTLANFLSYHYKVNRSYVVAGCILHDLCKIYELTEGPTVDYTEEGKLIGHLVQVLEVVDRFSFQIPNFPADQKMHLKHILLSHHGEYEYGSPKIPSSSEAYLVHLIDLMDSKMSSMDQIKKADSTTGNWSLFVKHLDRIVYKAELPTYTHFVGETKVHATKEEIAKPKTNTAGSNKPTAFSNLLKDFKVTDEE